MVAIVSAGGICPLPEKLTVGGVPLDGLTEEVKVTGLLKPFCGVVFKLIVPGLPAVMVCVPGVQVKEKSGLSTIIVAPINKTPSPNPRVTKFIE